MVTDITYSTNLFESLGVLNNFNLTENIWNKYEKIAVRKLESTTLKMKGILFSIDDISLEQAIKEHEMLCDFIPVFSDLRKKIKQNNNDEIRRFKSVAIHFFDTYDLLYEKFHSEIHKYSYNDETLAVLNEDTSKLKRYTSVDELVKDLKT